jgi:hypothetical protein
MIMSSVSAVGLGDLIDVGVEFDELIGHVDQTRAGVASETCQFNPHTFVSDSIYRIREILIA